MQDAWRAYLELASGLTRASRKKTKRVVKDLFGKGGATAAQVQGVTAELVAASRANRETLARLVRYEVDRALGAVGLATAEDVTTLTARIAELERQLATTGRTTPAAPPEGGVAAPGAGTASPRAGSTPAEQPGATAPVKKTVAKKTVAKKTVAKKAVGKKAVGKAAVKRAVPEKAGTQPTAAKKTAAKKTAAKKTPAKRAVASPAGGNPAGPAPESAA